MIDDRKEPVVSSVLSEPEANEAPTAPISGSSSPKKSWFGTFFILLWLITTSAIAGYALWQQQVSTIIMSEQQVRINNLEGQLLVIGDESTKNMTSISNKVAKETSVIESQLDEIKKESESLKKNAETLQEAIRKNNFADELTTISNAVATNTKSLANLTESVSKDNQVLLQLKASTEASTLNAQSIEMLLEQVSALSNEQKKHASTLANLQKTLIQPAGVESTVTQFLDPVKNSVKEQSLRLNSLKERIETLGREISSSSGSTNSANDILALQKQLDQQAEAIRSVDIFRQTVNRELLQLRKRVNAQ